MDISKSLDATPGGVPLSSLSPSLTHPPCLDSEHAELGKFRDDINSALAGALSRNGSVYERVSVLFLRWEDDDFLRFGGNGIQGEIDALEDVFVSDYGFQTEIFLIPSENSHRKLQKKIFHFADDDVHNKSDLLLVYYGGHGNYNHLNQSVWEQ